MSNKDFFEKSLQEWRREKSVSRSPAPVPPVLDSSPDDAPEADDSKSTADEQNTTAGAECTPNCQCQDQGYGCKHFISITELSEFFGSDLLARLTIAAPAVQNAVQSPAMIPIEKTKPNDVDRIHFNDVLSLDGFGVMSDEVKTLRSAGKMRRYLLWNGGSIQYRATKEKQIPSIKQVFKDLANKIQPDAILINELRLKYKNYKITARHDLHSELKNQLDNYILLSIVPSYKKKNQNNYHWIRGSAIFIHKDLTSDFEKIESVNEPHQDEDDEEEEQSANEKDSDGEKEEKKEEEEEGSDKVQEECASHCGKKKHYETTFIRDLTLGVNVYCCYIENDTDHIYHSAAATFFDQLEGGIGGGDFNSQLKFAEYFPNLIECMDEEWLTHQKPPAESTKIDYIFRDKRVTNISIKVHKPILPDADVTETHYPIIFDVFKWSPGEPEKKPCRDSLCEFKCGLRQGGVDHDVAKKRDKEENTSSILALSKDGLPKNAEELLSNHEKITKTNLEQFIKKGLNSEEDRENLKFLAKYGIVNNTYNCNKCDRPTSLNSDKTIFEQIEWICRDCKKKFSVRTGSFFFGMRGKLSHILSVAATFIEDPTVSLEDMTKEFNLNAATSIKNRILDVVQLVVSKKARKRVGGPDKVVDVETAIMFTKKCKMSLANSESSHCIVFIERESQKYAIAEVDSLDAKSLAEAVGSKVKDGTKLTSQVISSFQGITVARSEFKKMHPRKSIEFQVFKKPSVNDAEAIRLTKIRTAYTKSKVKNRADLIFMYILTRAFPNPFNAFLYGLSLYDPDNDSL